MLLRHGRRFLNLQNVVEIEVFPPGVSRYGYGPEDLEMDPRANEPAVDITTTAGANEMGVYTITRYGEDAAQIIERLGRLPMAEVKGGVPREWREFVRPLLPERERDAGKPSLDPPPTLRG